MSRPDNTLGAAIGLHRTGRLGEAERAYRTVIEAQPRNADAFHLLGVLLHQAGHPEHGVEPLRQAIALAPGRAPFHAALGRALFAMSHVKDAIVPMRRAAELEPTSAMAWSDLGTVLQDAGDGAQAREVYHRALALEPSNTTARFNLAILAKDSGDLGGAIELMQEILRDAPDAGRVHTVVAGYLLEADRVDEARAHCDRALSLSSRDLMAMTLASVACRRQGDVDAARRWVGLERMIQVETLVPPPAYDSLDAFNAALEHHVLAHPTLEHERSQNATRNGSHTDNLLREAHTGPVGELATCLDEAIGRYLAALPQDPAHPYLSQRPTGWRLQAWAVVMRSQGHQLAHTHPDGWVSGVYYLRVPGAIGEDDPEQSGWIEFGRPLAPLLGDSEPEVRRIRPEEGRVVLFPSFFYHETVPFSTLR